MLLWQIVAPVWLITTLTFKVQGCDEFTDLDLHHAFIGTSLEVRLLLYTRADATCGHLLSHRNLSENADFNVSKPTTFVIHGYRPTGSPPAWVNELEKDLLARKDMNVIVVDWNRGAANVNYLQAVENTFKTAENLTAFILAMQENGASLKSIHMIGISLGAHISGFVGGNLNGKIGRITALDPAGPQFRNAAPEKRLDPSDAEFVDVLHTDMDALGCREPLGHIDFYANGGADQPGCPRTIFSGGAYFKCDHQRSVFLYMDALEWTCTTVAFPCKSYNDFLNGHCTSCAGFEGLGCPVFGYDIIDWKDTLVSLGQTTAYFTTNQNSPFCRTNYELDIVIWNQEVFWGYITIKLHADGEESIATINNQESKFKKFSPTRLLAQFDKDLQSVKMISLKFSSGNAFKPKYKLRVLRMRLKHLERKDRPLCRYDIILEENKDVTFRPIPCEEFNF